MARVTLPISSAFVASTSGRRSSWDCGHGDDHLSIHGFLRHPEGWRLAPAYDLNPMPDLLET